MSLPARSTPLPELNLPLPDFLNWQDGEVRLTGHRINLYGVIRRYEEGYTAEMLALHYPTLSLAHVHKVIAFYLENRPAVSKYVAEYHAELEEQERQHQPGLTLQMLRERIAKRHSLEVTAGREFRFLPSLTLT
jgi:uncharacterized protein (DUF433 family)